MLAASRSGALRVTRHGSARAMARAYSAGGDRKGGEAPKVAAKAPSQGSGSALPTLFGIVGGAIGSVFAYASYTGQDPLEMIQAPFGLSSAPAPATTPAVVEKKAAVVEVKKEEKPKVEAKVEPKVEAKVEPKVEAKPAAPVAAAVSAPTPAPAPVQVPTPAPAPETATATASPLPAPVNFSDTLFELIGKFTLL